MIRKLRREKRGVASIIGMMMVVALLVLTVATLVTLESSFRSAIYSHSDFILSKRQESFILIDSFPDGSKIRVMNRGPIAIHIVAVYVNHALAKQVTNCQVQNPVITPCIISPESSVSSNANLAWISTGIKLKFGDVVSVTSDRGNRATATFPIGRTGFSSSTNLYVGTGPLTIIFTPNSFNYTALLPNGTNINAPRRAWGGMPSSSTNAMFYLLIVNHGLGDVLLREESVFYITSITGGGTNVKLFCIADPSSTPSTFIQYNRNVNPYVIPDNPNGDLAVGGAPVLVKFAGTGASSCNNNGGSQVLTSPQVSAVLLGMVYYWNGDLYSQDIPFATLLLT